MRKYEFQLALFAMALIAGLTFTGMALGHDGVLYTTGVGLIGGIAGYHIAKRKGV
ncbi:MAG: hypothetical protein J7J61_03675 [Candidatus Hydrothermae bacterium]|nr:hypothetical protein [Candidatus Hydrothermae bacterium]